MQLFAPGVGPASTMEDDGEDPTMDVKGESMDGSADEGQAPASKEGAQAKGKATAKGKSRGRKSAPAGAASCSCPSCESARKGHSKYCERHKRNYDNMMYQRSRNENEEERKAFDAAMANTISQAQEVERFGIENPGDMKYKRHNLIQWCRFTRQYGQRTEQAECDRETPYTKEKFTIYATDQEGLSAEEAATWWKSFYDNPAIDRDNSGPFGREVLYLPLHKFRERKRLNYIDVGFEEGSKEQKNASVKYRQVLRQHVQHQEVSHASEFLRGSKPDVLRGSTSVGAAEAGEGRFAPCI